MGWNQKGKPLKLFNLTNKKAWVKKVLIFFTKLNLCNQFFSRITDAFPVVAFGLSFVETLKRVKIKEKHIK